MSLKTVLFNVLTARWEPKIVHETRGRVRINIPLLKKIPPEFRDDAGELLAMASLIPGIQNATVSFVTANALIHFDHRKLSPPDILNAFIFLKQFIIDNRNHASDSPGHQLEALKEKLPGMLRDIDLKTLNTKEFQYNAL